MTKETKIGEYEIWWSSLPVKEKERIASKAQKKEVLYPACTAWWAGIPEEDKARIHAHCTEKHGDILREWDDANPYGD